MTDLIGRSPAFTRLINTARLVAATEAPVLLLGEPGSGKSALAREIHATSRRRAAPCLVFGCTGARPEALAAMLESADPRATLYLQEVGDLCQQDQARIVNLIRARDSDPHRADLRIIAGSSEDLAALVEQGRFRRDLELRLGVVPLDIPPLRERVLDIPALTDRFLADAGARHGVTPPRLDAGAQRLLRRYPWPGNLRELANLCERLTILLPGAAVGPENLPRELRRGAPADRPACGFALPPQGVDLNGLEAELIRQALSLAGGNKSRAARLLGLTRDTLLYRLQKHLISG